MHSPHRTQLKRNVLSINFHPGWPTLPILFVVRSALFPDRAMTMFGLALNNDNSIFEGENMDTAFTNLSLKFLHPGFCSFKCVCVGDIIDDNGGLGSSVVHGSQTVVSLLARSVPDLKLRGNVMDNYACYQCFIP